MWRQMKENWKWETRNTVPINCIRSERQDLISEKKKRQLIRWALNVSRRTFSTFQFKLSYSQVQFAWFPMQINFAVRIILVFFVLFCFVLVFIFSSLTFCVCVLLQSSIVFLLLFLVEMMIVMHRVSFVFTSHKYRVDVVVDFRIQNRFFFLVGKLKSGPCQKIIYMLFLGISVFLLSFYFKISGVLHCTHNT